MSKNSKSSANQGDNNGREANGRFAHGNSFGCGNPFARQVAHLRKEVLQVVDEVKLRALIERLYEVAMKGDVAAMKLLLSYTLGKPTVPAEHPDRLDLQEWEQMKEESEKIFQADRLIGTPELGMFLNMARVTRPSIAKEMTGKFADKLEEDLAKEKAQEQKKSAKKSKAKEKATTKKGQEKTDIDIRDFDSAARSLLQGNEPLEGDSELLEVVNCLSDSDILGILGAGSPSTNGEIGGGSPSTNGNSVSGPKGNYPSKNGHFPRRKR